LAQIGSLQKDTLMVKKTESNADSKEQDKKGSDNMQSGLGVSENLITMEKM